MQSRIKSENKLLEPVNEIIILTRSPSGTGTRERNNYAYNVTCDQRERDV